MIIHDLWHAIFVLGEAVTLIAAVIGFLFFTGLLFGVALEVYHKLRDSYFDQHLEPLVRRIHMQGIFATNEVREVLTFPQTSGQRVKSARIAKPKKDQA